MGQHTAPSTELHGHMRVLTDDEHVFDREGDERGGPAESNHHGRAEPPRDRDVDRRDGEKPSGHTRPSTVRRLETRQSCRIPEVAEPVDDGEERQPILPADADDATLETRSIARRERRGRRIEILPAGPLVVAPVNVHPHSERNRREESGDMADDHVQRRSAKQRAVSAFVKEHEPLDERGREQQLSCGPGEDVRAQRQPHTRGRGSQCCRDEERSLGVRGSQMPELGRRRRSSGHRGALPHDRSRHGEES